jgi:pimeloyl-ACP methyl ester carboxylesterase
VRAAHDLKKLCVDAFSSNLASNIIVHGAGHFLAEERPAEVVSALAKFLAI